MAVHRRQLPLAYRCDGFVPAPGSTGEGGFCEQCRKQVHDVSAMRESELRRLLAAHAGGTVCLAYRTDARGRVRLQPEPPPLPSQPLIVGALASLLAACAGHAGELEIPGATCRDADGYVVSCADWTEPEMRSTPEADALAARDPGGEGCPVQPTAPLPTSEPLREEGSGLEPPIVPPVDRSSGAPAAPAAGAAAEALPATAKARVNFSIDPSAGPFRGILVVSTGGWIERDFVPTAELWKQWRQRRAERKAERLRWRAMASR